MAQPGFQFVTVQAGKSNNSKTWVARDERRKVRVTVMQDYVRQKKDLHHKFLPAKVSMDMKAHMARFRPVSKADRAAPKHVNPYVKQPKQHFHRPLALKLDEEDGGQESKAPRAYGLGGIDPFSIVPVDMSDSETMKLMEYYFKSYWSNSLAVNPNGGWTLVALKDKATVHAKLSLVAVHRADSLGEGLPPIYLKHRGHALQLITQRLAEGGDSLSDDVIGAVSILSSSDYHSCWPDEVLDSHAVGIAALVEKRGGIDAPKMNKNVSRVIAWTDMLHSALREHAVMLGRSRYAQEVDLSEFTNLTGKAYRINEMQRRNLQHLPQSIRHIIRQLRILSDIKATLSTRRIFRLCEIFSDMVWKVEYDILDLTYPDGSLIQAQWYETSIFGFPSALAALRDAFILYSYMAFRDQNSISLYTRLSRRLARYIFELVSSLESLRALPSSELLLLVWVLYTGWKGAALARESTSWLASQAAQVCQILVLDEEDKAMQHVKSLAWNEESDSRHFPSFWDELKDSNVEITAL